MARTPNSFATAGFKKVLECLLLLSCVMQINSMIISLSPSVFPVKFFGQIQYSVL